MKKPLWRVTFLLLAGLLLALAVISFRGRVLRLLLGGSLRQHTVAERVRQYGPAVHARIFPDFRAAHAPYPPTRLVLVGLKEERQLLVYAVDARGNIAFIRRYPVLAASGSPGPKLREGDGQVPEGLYRIESLNPNSLYHLALRVSYPNAFDKRMAARDSRDRLGGDIMIHGSDVSIGCLAVGNAAAEDLFVMAAETGLERIEVILSPLDFRVKRLPAPVQRRLPAWTNELYAQIRARLATLPRP